MQYGIHPSCRCPLRPSSASLRLRSGSPSAPTWPRWLISVRIRKNMASTWMSYKPGIWNFESMKKEVLDRESVTHSILLGEWDWETIRSVYQHVKTFSPQLGNLYGALSGNGGGGDRAGGGAEAVVVRFFGIFFAFFQSSAVWGALISSIGKLQIWARSMSSETFLQVCCSFNTFPNLSDLFKE